ncbi:MAG: hypothetical protein D6785_12910, partial [Planctomycetota bacterium]
SHRAMEKRDPPFSGKPLEQKIQSLFEKSRKTGSKKYRKKAGKERRVGKKSQIFSHGSGREG